MLEPHHQNIIERTYREISVDLEGFGIHFYENLFTIAPETRQLFPEDLTTQRMKLMQMVGFAVSHLHMPDILQPTIENLGKRHIAYGVNPDQFQLVGQAMLMTLEQILGDTFQDDVREAWQKLYAELENIALSAYGS